MAGLLPEPPEAPPAETSKTQKKKVAQGTWSSSVRRQLEKADARAATALEADDISTEAVERVLAGIAEWPTQARPNVSPDAKAVTGMCLGAVNVLGGVGMQLSAVSQNFQNLVKLVGCYLDPEGREYRDRGAVFAQLEHLRDRREGVVFIAAATDAGPREGYVFTRGYLGRGYYDADWPRAATEAAPDSDRDLWSRLSPHFFRETSDHEYNSGRCFSFRTSFRPVEERSGGGRKFREIRDNEFLSKIVDDCPEPLRRALVEANAEEPLEVLGCGYDEGSKGWDEHSGEVFLINRRFVFEREAKQCGV